ncbi:glycosyltransferase family 2 protein [Pseudovibrio sp. SCP19]|uniref:glycosyltransferase family 2 protein n=1 Tax=Pseudovibrio sp. SCP19 TaxID=3141374 RepID=UPI00333C3A5D
MGLLFLMAQSLNWWAGVVTSVCDLFDFDEFPKISLPEDGIIVITRARNEMLRLPFFLEHYRSIGASHIFVVDNDSTDDTAAFLETQPDVTRFHTSKLYKQFKRNWLLAILNEYCTDRWTILADTDEQFVYPGWPETKLTGLTAYWDSVGAEGVIAPLIDMYSDKPLVDVDYRQGDPFLSTCPYFDTTSTWATQVSPELKGPRFEIRGGIRGRLFGIPPKRREIFPLGLLRSLYLAPARVHQKLPFRNYFERRLKRFLKKQCPQLMKVPLIRWNPVYSKLWGTHELDIRTSLADDWGAMLHFKFFQDFKFRVEEELTRQAYYADGLEYKAYYSGLEDILHHSPMYEGSMKFTNVSDVYRSQQAYCSSALLEYLKNIPHLKNSLSQENIVA